MQNTFVSDVSQKTFSVFEQVKASTIRPSILARIQKDHPQFNNQSSLSIQELNTFREKYIAEYMMTNLRELTQLEKSVLNSLTDKTTLSDKVDTEEEGLTLGQRVADVVADFGGSWVFILSFIGFLIIWILFNVFWLANKGFDPFPFILLNLILSCIAALQAPVIMMSQNRQEEKDRDRARKDYMINLKSELEIRSLHDKIDHLIIHQQQHLLEIQHIQIEMMNDIMEQLNQIKK
ncbi:MAG: DUF1003 domain-containing protein [Bacteroidota bacterium]|jgi:uncharacterized membrane protein